MTNGATGKLAGRRIVVTGAGSGIGRATAELFASEGAACVLLDLNDAGFAWVPTGARSTGVVADVTDYASVERALSNAASRLGGLDGIVNSAGIMLTGRTEEFSLADWHRTIDINLTGSFNVIKAALPYLKREPGATIVNIASGAGILPNFPGVAAYAASKGGVIALTKALAADLAPDIRVNCVCPGLVDTPLAGDYITNTAAYALKRAGQPDEIARSILFLTSADSSYTTGATLASDGGRTFH